jgi:alkanesulfonate monooxygenase SsuD/methylene tetrahydromethanopterin reductase-like flavin-dependent oxidoreductase (luciferase family)
MATMSVAFRTPSFGINIHARLRPDLDVVAEALHAERLGFDLVTLHGDVLQGSAASYETWTLLTWVAAHTTHIRIAPVVLALPNRHPAVLAKMSETLQHLTDGRLVLTLGSGAAINEPAFRAFGLAQRSSAAKVAALEEAIDVLRGLWSISSFSYAGQHFRLESATIEPKPSHPIPIWLGVFGDRMIDLVGRKADGWLPTFQFLAPEQAYRKLERIRMVAEDAGRNPDELTYAYNVPVLVEDGSSTARGQIAGSAAEVAQQLAEFVRHGFTFLNLWPSGAGATQRERLAKEVLPMVRDLLA